MNLIVIMLFNNDMKVYEGSKMFVFLDFGLIMILFLFDFVVMIVKDFGVDKEDDNGFYCIDCGLIFMNGILDFFFNGFNIRVLYKEMIREVFSNLFVCFLGIILSKKFIFLGDIFLWFVYGMFLVCYSVIYGYINGVR